MQFNPVTNSYGANSSNDVIASDAMREYQEAIEREEAEAERKRQLEAQRDRASAEFSARAAGRNRSWFGGRRSRKSKQSKKSKKSRKSRKSRR